MVRRERIFNWNHVSENLTEDQISELKALYKFYHKQYWLHKESFKSFKKKNIACNIGSVVLIVTGTVAGGVTLNPAVLGSISGAGLPLHQEPGKKSGKPGQVWFNQTYQAFVKKTSLVKSLVRLVLPGF